MIPRKGKTNKAFGDQEFRSLLKEFLCGFPMNNIFKEDVHFVGEEQLNCTSMNETPHIQTLVFHYKHER